MTSIDAMPEMPNAQESEAEVLGLVIWDTALFKRAQTILSLDDFYNPILRELWMVMVDMDQRGTPVTPGTVMAAVTNRGGAYTDWMLRITTDHRGDSRGLDWHCNLIEEAAIARDAHVEVIRASQRLSEDWAAGDLKAGAIPVIEEVITRLRVIQGYRRGEAGGDEFDVNDLIQRVLTDDQWIIEDVLARGERIMITAAEGWGKSTLLRQLGACIAAGIHPFTQAVMEPKRVLVVDAENPASINTVEWGRLISHLDMLGERGRRPEAGMLTIKEIGPCNLIDPKEAAKLYDVIDRVKPDVIFIGPLYQLFEGNPNDEEPAKYLARVLDKARMMYDSSLVIEAHTPHSDTVEILRPYGASLWKRWPEFGYCLHDDGSAKGKRGQELLLAMQMRESDFTPWRGSRSMGRRWPYHLSAGSHLPWETADLMNRNQEPAPIELDDVPEQPQPEQMGMGYIDRDTGEWREAL